MSRTSTTTLTVRLGGPLSDFVAANVGEHGDYENVSEYLRDLIRKQRDVEKLRGMLLEGVKSGPATPMEPDFFDKMRERAHARAAGP